MYHVEWVDGAGPGEVLGSFLVPDCLDDITTEKGEQLKVPQWEHPGDYQVIAPAYDSKREPDRHTLDMCIVAFDRGAAGKLGAGGYGVAGEDGRVFLCRGRWYGEQHCTNNEAELEALLDLLRELHTSSIVEAPGRDHVLVVGDSRLILDFAMRRARPGKASLFLKCRELQGLVR